MTDLNDQLARFERMSQRVSSWVIRSYSSSFSLASGLLDARTKRDIHHLYAVVRIADEIVDGAARQAGLASKEIADLLDDYEQQVLDAPHRAFHTDPILHAYGETARACGFNAEHIRAFFRSMRMDLDISRHTEASAADYIYGSAEVIGLLCVDIFLREESVSREQRATLDRGARALGSAFQKVNFLRDFGEDAHQLGRLYLPATRQRGLDEQAKAEIVGDIRNELAVASRSLYLLPSRPQLGVRTAIGIFEELTDKIEATSAADVQRGRVRISAPRKLVVSARTLARSGLRQS
ncbi:phytoene/squalene synthase family protein [Corynebacterium dentalis]|uniref:phytoene/squalene synthase family protein n=1 Tax=Corynebacterium dentalis TaxID=2014528 RepID=UPI00289A08D7|nr:squalene/phytoene synthase family protein [Corynebacterium dentalis]